MSKHDIDKSHVNNLILGYYIIIERIGEGSFGEVYLAEDKKQRKFALKIEDKKENKCKLSKEYKVYKLLNREKVSNVPRIYRYIETQDYNILAMELLGPSLEELLNMYNRKINVLNVIKLGYDIVGIMETFHNAGLIHRDIKPNNFLIGRMGNACNVYIMDFGLSKQYIKNEYHIPESKIKSMIGTPRYASINIHNGIEPSRRDDLESIGYMLIYLIKGKLPWQGIKHAKKQTMHKMIGEKKQQITIEDLTTDLPVCFYKYLNHVKSLNFDETPDYDYLRELFIEGRDTSYMWI